MPRGNDTEGQSAALRNLADDFGRGVGNAEALIEATHALSNERVRKAEQLPRHAELTEEAKEKHIGKPNGPNGENVIDAAVRQAASGSGEAITLVTYEDEDGRHFVTALDDKGKAIGPDAAALERAANKPSRDEAPEPSSKR